MGPQPSCPARSLSDLSDAGRNPARAMLRGCAAPAFGTRFQRKFGLRDDPDRRPSCDRIRRVGGRPAVVVRASGLCAGRTGDPAAGRAVSRSVGRGHPQEPLSDHRCRRRGTVPPSRPHHSGGAGLSRLQPRRPAGGIQLSRTGVPLSGRGRPAERIPAGRHRIIRTAGSRRGRRRDAGARRWRRPPRSA